MNYYNGFELAQGIDIIKNGATMSADEIVSELERLERLDQQAIGPNFRRSDSCAQEDAESRFKGFERARKIAGLARHNPIIRQALSMAQHHNRPRLECMEVAVLGLAESNQHLQKVATDAVIHGRSAFIVDPSGIQAVDAERLNNVTAVRAMEDRIATLHDLIRRIHDELHYGNVYQWDDGSQVWRDMEAEVDGDPGREKPKQPPMTKREREEVINQAIEKAGIFLNLENALHRIYDAGMLKKADE